VEKSLGLHEVIGRTWGLQQRGFAENIYVSQVTTRAFHDWLLVGKKHRTQRFLEERGFLISALRRESPRGILFPPVCWETPRQKSLGWDTEVWSRVRGTHFGKSEESVLRMGPRRQFGPFRIV